MNQSDLFMGAYPCPYLIRSGDSIVPPPEPPYQAHSTTSKSAAEKVKPKAPTERERVLEYIRNSGPIGATDDEIQIALAMNPSTQRPRRVELWKAGLVQDRGQTRLTRGNRQAVVWVAV